MRLVLVGFLLCASWFIKLSFLLGFLDLARGGYRYLAPYTCYRYLEPHDWCRYLVSAGSGPPMPTALLVVRSRGHAGRDWTPIIGGSGSHRPFRPASRIGLRRGNRGLYSMESRIFRRSRVSIQPKGPDRSECGGSRMLHPTRWRQGHN